MDKVKEVLSSIQFYEIYEEIFQLYLDGIRSFDDLTANNKLMLLSKLCKVDYGWLISDSRNYDDPYEAPHQKEKDKTLSCLMSYLFINMVCPGRFVDSSKLASDFILSSEVYFSGKIDALFDAISDVPGMLDKVMRT